MSLVDSSYRDKWVSNQNVLYRRDRLVYAENLKNASTYFGELMTHNKFVPIKASDVNWKKDHVFGFISSPMKFRAKGITEDLLTFYSVEQYLLNNLGRRFWTHHLTFGPHSVPISLRWQSKVEYIDWIPLDREIVDPIAMLRKLFEKHSMTLDVPEGLAQHKSSPYKQEVYEQISKYVIEGSDWLNLMLSYDIDLYNTVSEHFNHKGKTWDQVSWIENARNRKKSQSAQ